MAVLAATLTAGCGPSAQPISFKHPPKHYRTVISLSPGTTEVLASAVQYNGLAGRTAADDFPAGLLTHTPIVETTKPDYEKIESIRPDLIVYDSALLGPAELAKLRQFGADMFALNADTYPDYRLQLFKLGALLGGESKVSDYIDRVTIDLNDAAGKLPNPSPKVAVIMPSPNGDDWIDGTGSFLADLIKRCGGTPVGPKGDLFVKLSPEELVKDNPDLIFTSAPNKDPAGTEAFLKDPRFQSVSAVKNTFANPKQPKVVAIDADILLRRGARVDVLLEKLAPAIGGTTAASGGASTAGASPTAAAPPVVAPKPSAGKA